MSIISEGTKVFVDGYGEALFTVTGFDSAEGGWYGVEYVNQELNLRGEEDIIVPMILVRPQSPASV